MAAVSSLSPAAPTREMSTETAGAFRSIGRESRPVEHSGQRPGAQQVEGEDQVGDAFLIAGDRAGSSRGAEDVRPLLDDREHVGDRRLASAGQPLVEQVDGPA